MKKIFYLMALFLISGIVFSQDNNPESYKNTNPYKRMEAFYQQRAYPNEEVPKHALSNAIHEMESKIYDKMSDKGFLLAQQPDWKPIGPNNVGGRIKSIALHPTIKSTLYIGAACGGVWRTTNSGDTWEPLMDFETGIAMGALAIDPNNPEIIYAGTGEALVSGAAASYYGSGMFKTTDAGKSWKLIAFSDVAAFSKIYVHPMNSNLIIAGTVVANAGFFKSTDAGATWKKLYSGNVNDIVINPKNQDEYFMALNASGIMYTSDGGASWVNRFNGITSFGGRISIAAAASDFNILYTLLETGTTKYANIYKSTNKGDSWSNVYAGTNTFFNGQGWYDNCIAIDPNNPKIVLAGGVMMYRTSDGGNSWITVNNNSNNGYMHVDQQVAMFNPLQAGQVYVGNDGGIYVSHNSGFDWLVLNNNLQVTQFYAMAIDNKNVNRNFGGTQDNGTVGNINTDKWSAVGGGDGFEVDINPLEPNTVYGEVYYGIMWKTTYDEQGKISSKSINNGIPASDSGAWQSPLYFDKDYQIVYNGRHALYASYNNGGSFVAKSPKRTDRYSAITSSKVLPDIVWTGNETGYVWVSSDLCDSWTEVQQNGLIAKHVTDIECSLKDQNTAYISYSGYGSPHIFKTTDLGKTWKNISLDLPDVPVNALAIHPDNESILFAATDVGVFATFDGGTSWVPYGRKLPRVPVTDIQFHGDRTILPTLTLRAATMGRSMWEIAVGNEAVDGAEIVAPVGGELFTGTAVTRVTWYGFTPPVKIEYSLDNGIKWNTIGEKVLGTNLMWGIPNENTMYGRIRITSETNTSISLVSNAFTISRMKRGSSLKTGSVSFIPYGIVMSDDNALWVTSFLSNKLTKVDLNSFTIKEQYTLPGTKNFTDITFDKTNKLLYIHRMNDSLGNGAKVLVVNSSGQFVKEFASPAKKYPIGLAYVDGKLYCSERDGTRNIYIANPETGALISQFKNPFDINSGPRGLTYDGSQYLYQASTSFPNDVLDGAYILKMSKNAPQTEIDRIALIDQVSSINARGIDIDPSDNNFWISSYGGSIYKIAGFNAPLTDVKEYISNTDNFSVKIAPNPVFDLCNIMIKTNLNDLNNIHISLFDVLGNKVLEIFDGNINSGDYKLIQSDMSNLVAGSYRLIAYQEKNIIFSQSIVKIK